MRAKNYNKKLELLDEALSYALNCCNDILDKLNDIEYRISYNLPINYLDELDEYSLQTTDIIANAIKARRAILYIVHILAQDLDKVMQAQQSAEKERKANENDA